MSRLGKKPIQIPEGVEVEIKDGRVKIVGPKGEISRSFGDLISIEKKDSQIELKPASENSAAKALWGTYVSHIKNMLTGAKEGFSKTLLVEGVGYKSQTDGTKLVLNLGFSHSVEMPVPKNISIKVEKNKIEVFGVDKELVGETAARIRAFKKPEPYKGKGIRYENEVIRRKAGKKAVGSA